MRNKKAIIGIIISGILSISATARDITGRVIDENNEPMAFANAVLLNKADSTYISGTVTDENGNFALTNGKGLPAFVRLTSTGYTPVFAQIPPSGEIGIIAMTPQSTMLGEVTVKADLPMTSIRGTSLVTNVENSILSFAGTANDVLAQVPMVIGQDGNFEVFGKGTPIIYINGRRIQDNNDLSQLNSSDIKSVEVVTSPGAKYDASVKSVIRIRTKRPQGDGLSGNMRVNNGFMHYFRTGEQLDLKFRSRGLEVFTTLGYYGGKSYDTSEMEMTTISTAVYKQAANDISRTTYNEFFGKIGFDYMINENHSAGAYYQNGYNKHETDYGSHSDMTTDGSPYDVYDNHSDGISKRVPKHFANAYYNGSFGNLGIDINVDYLWNKDRANAVNNEQSQNFDNAEVSTNSQSRSRLFAEKLILSYPLWKGGIEAGNEYTSSRFSTAFNTNTQQLQDASSQVDENNNAFFLELSQSFGRVNVAAGLRYEHVNFSYKENGIRKDGQSKTYDNLFPSLSVSTMAGNVQMALGYNSKTMRPSYSTLDGTTTYINRFTYKSGNPYLKPATTHSVEMMAAWKMFFAQISYQYTKDPIMNATRAYATDERIRLITYDNFDRIQKLSAFAGANLQLGIWQPRINAGVIKQWIEVPYNGARKQLNNPMALIQWQNAIHLPGDIWLNIDAQWRSNGDTENIHLHSSSYLNAKLYKSFLNDQLSVTVEAKDIFNKNYEKLRFYNGDVTIREINRNDSRSFFVTLQYRFNTSRDRYRGRGAGDSEKSRF